MKKSALALTTALSLLAFAPAHADDMTGVDPNCIVKNADGTQTVDKAKCPDGKSMNSTQNTTTQPADQNAAQTTQPADNSAAPAATTAEQPAAPTGTTTDQGTAQTTQPTDNSAAPSTTAQQPADTTAPATTTAEQPANTTAPATANGTLIVPADVMKGAKVMSANDYIGKRVYDRAGNDIGEVNDLIISNDGKIQATILGVGGFLGIGEKDVAVAVSSVEMVKDGDSVKLVVDASKEQLEQAPTFNPTTRNYAG